MKRGGYFCEDEVGRLIHNLAQWGGDGVAVRTAPSIMQRLLAELRKGSGPVITVGIDAGHTKTALLQLGEELGDAITTYHLSSLTIEMQARDYLRIAKTTYYRRLEVGHVEFMAAYHLARRGSKL